MDGPPTVRRRQPIDWYVPGCVYCGRVTAVWPTYHGRVEAMVRVGRHWRYPLGCVATAATLVVLLAGTAGRPVSAAPLHAHGHVALASGCTLANGIRHVIYIEFDNTHFMRDIGRDGSTDVPSDLEQMPHYSPGVPGRVEERHAR